MEMKPNSTTSLLTQFTSFHHLLLLMLFSKTCHSGPPKTPRLTPFFDSIVSSYGPKAGFRVLLPDFKTYFFNQTLDHFNYGPNSYDTFRHRYIVNSNHWAGGAAPIFAWLGAEAPIDDDPLTVGFLTDIAPSFKALLVYIEHRFYGESIPMGKMEDAMRNETLRGFFNSGQALADYAQVLLHIKTQFNATKSPILVVGGSYGGMLAAWFRMKYPHVAMGALASSAPILYFDNITPQDGYFSRQTCYESIRQSWAAIDKLASSPNGLSILTRKFNLCTDLKSPEELKNYLQIMYAGAAQYNAPPKYPVTMVCGGIDGGGMDILDRIHGGVVAFKD
ncbi:hypothetical protein DM860_000075 [Cuscuta australis]|uniref:Serine carboxypeptidase S28 family protein n=1 Tax=Cuscuta australis TaxID=267555 RepID=A0A328CYI9_9ASTE|nr:hypothetical protein DM860_000075 [Cuscuta australis]